MSPDIDTVITFNSIRNAYRDAGKLVSLWFHNVDMLIVPYLSENNYARFISRIAGKKTVGYDQKGSVYDVTIPLERKHELEINLDIVRTILPGNANTLVRDLTPFVRRPDRKSGQLKVGFHASTHPSMPEKCWPYRNFAALGRLLKSHTGAVTCLFGAKSDNLHGFTNGDFDVNLVGKLDLKGTMERIADMDFFVTNDSGLMHIAASLQVPVVSIFGPTDEFKNAPVGRQHLVIKLDLGCRPCYRPWGKIQCLHDAEYKCLRGVSPETVFSRIKESGFLT
jgi:ADP-heptose:LPS heptosyltransferase